MSRYAAPSWFATIGAVAALNWTSRNADTIPVAAYAICGVWNAPPTLSAVTRRTPSSFAREDAASSPSAVPAITTCPGALSLAIQHATGAAGSEANAVLEIQRAGRDERGHLSE